MAVQSDRPPSAPSLDSRERAMYEPLQEGRGIRPGRLREALAQRGFVPDDPRLRETFRALERLPAEGSLNAEEFRSLFGANLLLLERALRRDLVIPEFEGFRAQVDRIFEGAGLDEGGALAAYIPQLSRMDPAHWGLSLCTIDGQRHRRGSWETPFSLQSVMKPINYCIALEEHGEDLVHRHIGREPSGFGFNELRLNRAGLPHNPMVNAGAIMACALIRPGASVAGRFEAVMDTWQALCGGQRPSFNNAVYLSERQTADRNFALGYFMREKGAFPPGTDLHQTLDFYFQCCSVEVSAEVLSVVAGTLANGGVCPLTGERVFQARVVRHCLSLMSTSGMYDFSGEFAFRVGLPAKSGVSGAMMVVIPNVMGIGLFSPRLDPLGNSVRGLSFCEGLVDTFPFHRYDNLTGLSGKWDPRRPLGDGTAAEAERVAWAARRGDAGAQAIQSLIQTLMIYVVSGEGGVSPEEAAAIEEALERLTPEPVEAEALQEAIGTPPSREEVGEVLRRVAERFDDTLKGVILRACALVARADGEATEAEQTRLAEVGRALGIPWEGGFEGVADTPLW